MAALPTLFADGILEASIRHGVARLKLAVQDGDGKPSPSGLVAIPLAQLPGVAATLTRLLREVETKAREAQATVPAAGGEAAPEDPPAAFRFQG